MLDNYEKSSNFLANADPDHSYLEDEPRPSPSLVSEKTIDVM
jgi:hypothetical protein